MTKDELQVENDELRTALEKVYDEIGEVLGVDEEEEEDE
jgi:hypothetical protein